MRTRNLVTLLSITGATLLFFCFDRLSKIWAAEALASADMLIFGNFVRFHLTYNRDIAFSIPVPGILQVSLSIIFLVFLIWYFVNLQRPKNFGEMAAVSLLFGGALGNLVDRLLYGQVLDFIAVGKFPIFNLADSFLFLGVCFFLIKEFYSSSSSSK